MAYAMMMQGSSGEPVKHWTQGLARALQGGMGGYELYREDQETKENEAAQSDALIKALGGGQPQAPQAPVQQMPPQRVPVQSQAPQRSPVVAALSPSGTMSDAPQVMTPPAQKVAPSSRVWGTDEGEAAGLYPPSKPAMQAPPPQAPPLAFNDRFAALNPQANPQQAGQLQPVPVQTQSVAPPPPQLAQAPQGSDINQQIIQMLQDKNPQVQKLGRGMAAATVQKRLEGEKPTDEMREYDLYRRQGGKDSFFDFKANLKRAGAIQNNVQIDQKGEGEFSKESGKLQAKRFDELASEGVTAKQMESDVGMLLDLGKKIGTGKGAEVKAVIGPYADALGIKIDGLSDIQAFEAIVNRVAPTMRVKGTGAQSDFELRNFLKQFPSIGATEDGNALIGRTLQGFIQNKMAAAQIGSAALTGEITRSEAERRIRELPDPMKEWREYQKTAPKAQEAPDRAAIEQEMKRRGLLK
jgi:hypothetical protein